jgi:creatinine amidohydrolase
VSGSDHELALLAYTDVERLLASAAPKVAIVPVGSVEAHGPHLPLATDTLISEEVARRAGRELAVRGWIALRFPPVCYGVTEWARMFAGSTSISTETTAAIVLEVCRAARRMGCDRVAIVNAHLEPGHIATLREVARRYEDELGEALVFADKTRRKQAERLTDEFRSGSCHAGQYETSLVLAIRPELVQREVANALPEHVVPLHERIAGGAHDFADCGLDRAYCGNPAGATREEGERSLEVLAAMVVEAVEAAPPR